LAAAGAGKLPSHEFLEATMLKFKVTYASLTADNQELHAQLDKAFAEVRAKLGMTFPFYVGGQARTSATTSPSFNPAHTATRLADVSNATPAEVNEAVAAARKAYPKWRATPWQERARLLERAAEIIRERSYELTAWLVLENGKNRVEALGEIEETADLYDYYAQQMRANDGFIRDMAKLSPNDTNTSVLRPYGVWAVVAPFNFPYALLGAPMAAALVTGNTVVGKPASDTPISGALIAEIFHQAGFPDGTVNLVVGPGRSVGQTLIDHPDVDGVTFTGSYEIGFHQLFKNFSKKYPKPCIAEMGGKNPAVISQHADIEKAAQGVFRSAFGMGGQKCSACSRVFVHQAVADLFVQRLKELAEAAVIGDPSDKKVFLGPVGVKSGFEDYQRYVDLARQDGKLETGGEVCGGDLSGGYFVKPTIVTGLPSDHELMRQEMFLPIVCVETFSTLDEGLNKANNTDLGLTAGFFSEKESEVEEFLDRIEAGVVYVNRPAGATTGAWPGVQPFGGWKGSGSSGKNIGGLYTVQCYMREQSRTVTR
jgi:1-pyrroline-5-carboxylate dehydrogenase